MKFIVCTQTGSFFKFENWDETVEFIELLKKSNTRYTLDIETDSIVNQKK